MFRTDAASGANRIAALLLRGSPPHPTILKMVSPTSTFYWMRRFGRRHVLFGVEMIGPIAPRWPNRDKVMNKTIILYSDR